MSNDAPGPVQIKMQSPYEHFRIAERYLASAAERRNRIDDPPLSRHDGVTEQVVWPEDRQALALDLEFAQVHATLATVQRDLA